MHSKRYLLFRSGSEDCAVELACVRQIARHNVLAPLEDEHSSLGRINAHGEIAEVNVPGGVEIENPALCIVAENEQGALVAYVADEIRGVEEDRQGARLLQGAPPRTAA